jgi:hypothetical protein
VSNEGNYLKVAKGQWTTIKFAVRFKAQTDLSRDSASSTGAIKRPIEQLPLGANLSWQSL